MSVCIECAVRYHEFREVVLPPRAKSTGLGVHNEAWIDGRKHRLGRVGPYHEACDNCCRVTGSLFIPTDA
jgi:hypothetical protein